MIKLMHLFVSLNELTEHHLKRSCQLLLCLAVQCATFLIPMQSYLFLLYSPNVKFVGKYS